LNVIRIIRVGCGRITRDAWERNLTYLCTDEEPDVAGMDIGIYLHFVSRFYFCSYVLL
jgi:hypothetical protein